MAWNKMLEAARAMRAVSPLECNRPWSISRQCEKNLVKRSGLIPLGGWNAFVGLLAGLCEQTSNNSLIFPVDLDDVTEDELRDRVQRLFIDQLMPPSAAASLFLMLGIHPYWGLRLAQKKQGRPPAEEASKLMPDAILDGLEEVIDTTIVLIDQEIADGASLEVLEERLLVWCQLKHEELRALETGGTAHLPLSYPSNPPHPRIVRSSLSTILDTVYLPQGFDIRGSMAKTAS